METVIFFVQWSTETSLRYTMITSNPVKHLKIGGGKERNHQVSELRQKYFDFDFGDIKGILLGDFLSIKKLKSGTIYADTMKILCEFFRYKRKGKPNNRWLILHENVPSHMSFASLDTLNKGGLREASHILYSFTIFPYYYTQFVDLKKYLLVQRF